VARLKIAYLKQKQELEQQELASKLRREQEAAEFARRRVQEEAEIKQRREQQGAELKQQREQKKAELRRWYEIEALKEKQHRDMLEANQELQEASIRREVLEEESERGGYIPLDDHDLRELAKGATSVS